MKGWLSLNVVSRLGPPGWFKTPNTYMDAAARFILWYHPILLSSYYFAFLACFMFMS